MFKVGDKVSWTSQSAGVTKTKTGVVVEVLPAGCKTGRKFGAPRDHESYLVKVGRSEKLYWPRVCHLKKYSPDLTRFIVRYTRPYTSVSLWLTYVDCTFMLTSEKARAHKFTDPIVARDASNRAGNFDMPHKIVEIRLE